jgi:hypothetical protein
MDISKSEYELLLPIIERINNSIGVTSVTTNSNNTFTLFTCNILWATLGFPITIGGHEYKIIDIEDGVSITVKPKTGSTAPSVGVFSLYVPKFYHGTIKATESDLNAKINNNLLSWDKLPMIWLHEPVEEIIVPGEEEAIYRKSNSELYFLNDADFAKWSNNDHYKYAIKPMRKLFMAFYDSMKYSGLINYDQIKSYKLIDLPRFGQYKVISGNKSNQTQGESTIFAQYHLSGTKVGIQISWLRQVENCCSQPAAIVNPGECLPVIIRNSNNTFNQSVSSGSTFSAPDDVYNIYFNGVLVESISLPSLVDHTINIIPTP